MTDARNTILLLLASLLLHTPLGTAQVACEEGDCLLPHGGPGCENQVCCDLVCGFDPFCCNSWDETCVSYASATCVGLCGANASGNCFVTHPNPGCDDADCCNGVCLVDPFCCESTWDLNCVLLAGFSCETGGGECGDPAAGDCLLANGSPACDDAACCEAVCDLEPRCCEVAWDAVCVAIAEAACVGDCEINATDEDRPESEPCDRSTNDPCDGGVAEPLEDASQVVGSFQDDTDVDVYEIDLTDLDLDRDGLVRLRLSLLTRYTCRITIGVADCKKPPAVVDTTPRCIDHEIEACVAAGPTWIRIEPTEPTGSCADLRYRLGVQTRDTCGETCGTGGDCLEPASGAGCLDAACCELVCNVDPECCNWEWDSSCAIRAADLCGGPPPINDACDAAIETSIGTTPFRQLLATLDGPLAWCGPGEEATMDVWFRHRVTCEGQLYFGTCGLADYETVVEVFRGDCDGTLASIGCEDDSAGCGGGTSLVRVDDATCGEELLVRVLASDGIGGNGSFIVDCLGSACACEGDLDGDGVVGGSDLGLLFVAWGACDGPCPADLDGDGEVGGSDLGLLFVRWGDC